MKNRLSVLSGLVATLILAPHAHAEAGEDVLRTIPVVAATPKRMMAIEDLLLLRDIDALSVSPDGSHFAILVRQAVPEKNSYRTGWFVGSTGEEALTFVGDGGRARLLTWPSGVRGGEISGSAGRWSPDGLWLAYLVERDDEIQLWRSRRDGRVREQLTHNAADVRDFAWSEDGRVLYFAAGTPRAQLQARDQAEAWRGYRLEDFRSFGHVITPGHPPRALEKDPPVWLVDIETSVERRASEEETHIFQRLRSVGYQYGAGSAEWPDVISGRGNRPVVSSRGSLAWLAAEGDRSQFPDLRVTVSSATDGSDPVACRAPECSSPFMSSVWWSADAGRVVFWNTDKGNGIDAALYTWSPPNRQVATILPATGERFKGCAMREDRLICLRESNTQPAHAAAIDISSGEITVLADVNPELKNVRFGAIERIEWDVPQTVAEAGYPPRAVGYILYPPDFDPSRKYPVFIAPYTAGGFHRGDVGDEHPLFVYAANGIVVLDTQLPHPTGSMANRTGTELMQLLYSAEHGFPHLTTLTRSTVRALDLVAARGFVDETRVGIGGVSHGSFVSLYMLQKEDRLAAASIAGGHWNPEDYYSSTPKGRPRSEEWFPAPSGDGLEWWNQIDIAQHVDKIEAPILFNLPDMEIGRSRTLIRHLENGHKPFDAYVFPDEYHQKWQSAHREALYRRNLDWFRFWLQDFQDPDPEKVDQYVRWRHLRELQCKNPRSLRDYCGKPN